ncbi:alanine--glyoxylate aminotransferase family protein [bacterium]|nr:alanine--glyoxylate aminotransferase family protein [bacterium]
MQKSHLFTPGPTMVPGDVALAGAKDMIHHRTDQFKAIYEKVAKQLKVLFETKQPVLVLLGSGTSAMEAAVDAIVAPGEKMITFNGGKFGERWGKIGKTLGCVVHEVQYGWDDCADTAKLEQALKDCPDAVAVFCQLNETASGIGNPVKELAEVCHKADKLIVVDGISGLSAMKCPMDEWGLDVVLTGSQKGLMLPPGLAMIALSEKAIAKMGGHPARIWYNDLRAALKNDEKSTHAWTSGVSLYQQLSVALDMMLAEGIDNIIHRCHVQGDAVRAAAKALGLELLNAKSPGDVLTSILMPDNVKASELAKYCRGHWGIYFAAGQDDYKDKIIRIGHLGYQDHFETIMAIAAFEMAMKHFGAEIELGKGVKVAQEILMADLEEQEKKAASAG